MDMTVEHGHRAEALHITERARAILGAPAPGRIDRPQRDMREHHDRRRGRAAFEIVLDPFELLVAEIAHAAALEIGDVDEPQEMHAIGVEAVIAGAFGAAAVALFVNFDVGVDDVVLARNVVHVEFGLRDDFFGVVEFGFLRQVRDVAGVDHEGRLCRNSFDAGDRPFQRALGIRVGRLVEAHMAVADLQKRQAQSSGRFGVGGHGFRSVSLIDQAERMRHPAADGPQHPGAGPGHAFQHLAAAGAVIVVCHRRSPLTRYAFRGLDQAKRRFIPEPPCGTAAGNAIYAKAMKFLDEAKVYVHSGAGGNGCIAFWREKFLAFGSPSGGDGGKGGDVIVEAVNGLNTLIDYRYQQHFKAAPGGNGMGKDRHGANGKDVVLKVPVGTQVYEEDGETLLADFTRAGQRVTLMKGGNGGFGNAYFKSSTNQAPRKANPGQPGEERTIRLRLKLIADAGIIGLPNAGKSTFLATVSAAKPKIADYPFTTLHPQLGVFEVDNREFVMADLPGLIEGAHEGVGLGDKFLGHTERCRVLLHLVDGTGEDAGADYKTVRAELEAYGQGLTDKPEIVALSKADALTPAAIKAQTAKLKKACKKTPLVLSSASGQGVKDVLRALFKVIDQARAHAADEPKSKEAAWQP